jgi:EAL domain-containing protein (putative c-di-GMP-specific phosphodiesterase class I)
MSAGFVASMASVMRDTGTEPARVTLEVTESALAYDDARALSVVGGLKHLGVNIALDDFGTGQSSLSRLKQFPVDSIKIDQAFVTDLEISIASRLIVGAVTDLAHGMGMTVVAEGVETAGQRAEVVKLNCDFSQGFYFAQPQSLASMNAIVSDRETLPLSDSSVHAAYRRSVRSGLEAGQLADSSAPSSDPVTPVDLGSSAPAMRRRHRP